MIADQVDVLMTVKDAAYLSRLKSDERAFLTTMSSIEASADRAGNALATVGNRGASGVAALDKQTRSLSNNTGNLAAQFNDIGVQLAGGQSPFLIALQQGTQINQVLGQAGAGGAVKALAGAFASLLNPVSLATIAIIALGGTAIQYFSTILNDGANSTEVIKEQNDLIRKVAENWGDAVPALRAYIDELDRAADASDLNEAYDVIIANAFARLKEQLPDLRAELAAARIDIEAVGGSAQEIDALQAAFDALATKVADGTATSADLDAVMSQLAGTTGSATVPSLINLQGVLAAVSQALGIAANAAARANAELAALNNAAAGRDIKQRFAVAEFAAEQERINGLTSEQLALENEIARVKSEFARDNEGVVLSDAKALEIANSRLSAEERRAAIIKANNAANKAGASSASDAERERKAVLDLIAALQFEQGLIGLSNAEKAVQNALRRAGAAATDEERAAIEELITTTYAQTEALAAAEAAMGAFENIAGNALGTFLNDIRQGKDAAESLSNIFDDIAGQLIQMAAQGLVKAALGGIFGGGGGFFGGLFGGKGFASGTANTGGMKGQPAGIVHGQEAVIPLPSGGKVPVQIQNGGSSGGVVEVHVVPSEYFDARVENVAGPVSAKVTRAGLTSYDHAAPGRSAEQDMRYR